MHVDPSGAYDISPAINLIRTTRSRNPLTDFDNPPVAYDQIRDPVQADGRVNQATPLEHYRHQSLPVAQRAKKDPEIERSRGAVSVCLT
jgi:hypothetical protein